MNHNNLVFSVGLALCLIFYFYFTENVKSRRLRGHSRGLTGRHFVRFVDFTCPDMFGGGQGSNYPFNFKAPSLARPCLLKAVCCTACGIYSGMATRNPSTLLYAFIEFGIVTDNLTPPSTLSLSPLCIVSYRLIRRPPI